MISRDEWRASRAQPGEVERALLVDIGTTSLTGVRATALPGLDGLDWIAHPVMSTLPLSAKDCAELGSDFSRTGFLFKSPSQGDGCVVDDFGIEWISVEGTMTPSRHPLEGASIAQIARHPRPSWPTFVQIPEPGVDDLIVIADPPCPGLLDLSFGLRNAWVCLEDMTDNRRSLSALLDWSLETITSAYEALLTSLPVTPDVVVYADDLGFQQNMFISEVDFRQFLRPRLQALLSRIRRLTPAAVCFHSCGSIRPILGDLADLGFDLINLDGDARGMVCSELRRQLPKDIIMHGCTSLVALGEAVRKRDIRSVGLLITELVDSMPAVAAPLDSLTMPKDIEGARLGAVFLRQLAPDDVAAVARLGPVKSIIEHAVSRALDFDLSPFRPTPARVTNLVRENRVATVPAQEGPRRVA